MTKLTWQLFGKEPCRVGFELSAKLHEQFSMPIVPQPRGHRPRDAVWDQRKAVWDQRKAAWIDCTGHEYDLSSRYSLRAFRRAQLAHGGR